MLLYLLLIEIGSALIILAGAILVSVTIKKAIKEQGSKKIEVSMTDRSYMSGKKISPVVDVKELTKIALQTKPAKVNINTDTTIFDGKSK